MTVDRITVLRAFGATLAKCWSSADKIEPYSNALQFRVRHAEVGNVFDLAKLLDSLATESGECIIRGRYIGDDAAASLLPDLIAQHEAQTNKPLKLRPGHVLRRQALFPDQPGRWVMIDVDSFKPANADPVKEPERACLEFVSAVLPACFHGRTFYWTLSGSAGAAKYAGVLKAHLWFWLAEPHDSASLNAWAKTVPGIDAGVFHPVQCHYTAAPLFVDGVIDPVPIRSGLYRGHEGDDVHLILASVRIATANPGTVNRKPMADPAEKQGLVGAFCRVFAPVDLTQLIPAQFEPGRSHKHFTWTGHAADGVFITECGHGLVNSHATSPPGSGSRCNIFDFVRLHLFGHLDPEAGDGTRMSDRPSFKAMRDWIAQNCPEVLAEVNALRTTAEEDFAGFDQNADEIIAALRSMPVEQVRSHWASMAAALPESEATRIVSEVAHLTGEKAVRPLNAALKEHREEDRRAKRQAEFESRQAGRVLVHYEKQDRTRAAREVEAAIVAASAPGQYISFGGLLAQVAVRELPFSHLMKNPGKPPPPVPIVAPLNWAELLAMAEAAAVLQTVGKSGPELMAIPKPIIEYLLQKTDHAAPAVAGLVTHPIVLPDGEILATDGLHEVSRLFLYRAAIPGARPYARHEARDALERLRANYLDGFEFSTPLDSTAAIAGLLTAIQRRVLDQAPGMMIVAASPSSGKTTLARRIHLLLTGHDMPVNTFPDRSEEEARKQILAVLLRSPPMVCFDNLAEGGTFRSSIVAPLMTSPEFIQRRLGENHEARVLTNVMFVFTGNNIQLGVDYTTRLMNVRLSSATSRPEQRKFTNPDVVGHALSIREAVLRDVLGIIAGYLVSGCAIPPGSRFQSWDRMVRQPLMWAGDRDVAEVFAVNADANGETSAGRGLVRILRETFGDTMFGARAVANLARHGRAPGQEFEDIRDDGNSMFARRAEAVHELLGALHAQKPTESLSVSKVLAALRDRYVDADGRTQMVLRAKPEDHTLRYWVEVIEDLTIAGVDPP